MSLESTKADEIALVVEEAIVSGELPPGTVLRQEQLSERFAVSRTPIREALRRLAALGLVSFEPNRGVRVRTLSREELREAFLVRAELESLATELAAPKMTEEDLDELEGAEAEFSQATQALRARPRDGVDRWRLTHEWVRANLSDRAEAVFLGGNGFRTASAIHALEEDLGRPVLTANSVTLWHALRVAGVRAAVTDYGRLFSQDLPSD